METVEIDVLDREEASFTPSSDRSDIPPPPLVVHHVVQDPSVVTSGGAAAAAAVGSATLSPEPCENPWPSPEVVSRKKVAIYTSGGDAPGMNAAFRAAAGVCLSAGVDIYAIHNGYSGLVAGGDMIRKVTWADINDIIHRGGTVIGSARCMEFKTREGRLRAAENLVKLGINSLIAVGGDGTLTGANLFKTEWADLVQELCAKGRITAEEMERSKYLAVVGMVGSIDNDMCGFSMTIGCDTSMHRIITAVDALVTTAASHQRSFIIEVMGRNCGFLALMTSLACGADYVFLPEAPPPEEDWESALCDSLTRRRKHVNFSLVILAEGATDRVRRPISSAYLKQVLEERLGHDTRVTCLGHVQRGGAASAYDRILATRCGAEAALAVLNADDKTPARIVGVRWNKMIRVDLTEAVKATQEVGKRLAARDFDAAMKLRGPAFKEEFDIYLRIRQHAPDKTKGHVFNIAIMHTGSPAAGMNAAAKAAVRDLINGNHRVFGVQNGFEGLARGDLVQLGWGDVKGWVSIGGAKLGTNRTTPDDIKDGHARIAATLAKHNIHGIMLIGGFEGFMGICQLVEQRKTHAAFAIPMVLIPATISNNVPGTDFALGTDTAINVIVDSIDRLKQSAMSSRRRVFIVETMGNYCGYLASAGGLAGGADGVYTFEEGLRVKNLTQDIDHTRQKLREFNSSVFVRNEKCSENYTTSFMQALFEEEGKFDARNPDQITYSVRNIILGHLQQGGAPSPLDRVRGVRLAGGAVRWLLRKTEESTTGGTPEAPVVHTMAVDSACVIGVMETSEVTTPVTELLPQTDIKHRLPRHSWWLHLNKLTRVLEQALQEEGGYQGESIVSDVFSS